MALLVQQIRNLVIQLQAAPIPQINIPAINIPAQHRELNLVHYPKFSSGEQDPISWLEDVEKAFEANQVQDARKIPVIVPKLKGAAATWWVTNQVQLTPIDRWNDCLNLDISFRPSFIAHFRTPALESKWFAQLTQRKQGMSEDVDSYNVAVEELLRCVEASGHRYPESAKAQMFINGLRPELSTSVAPFLPNSLTAAYERAKAFENSFKQNPHYFNPYLPVSTTTPQPSVLVIPSAANISPAQAPSRTEEAIVKLGEEFTAMAAQFKESKEQSCRNWNSQLRY